MPDDVEPDYGIAAVGGLVCERPGVRSKCLEAYATVASELALGNAVVLIFGLISGAVSSLMMLATVPFIDRIGFEGHRGEILGYTAIVLSFLLVFFGIRSYRENSGGTLTCDRRRRAEDGGPHADARQPLDERRDDLHGACPIGLVVALGSAAALRKKAGQTTPHVH